MSTRSTQVAIIGGGLAAFTAAETIRRSGADALMIHPQSPGATALWSGLGQAFGPAGSLLPQSAGSVEAAERVVQTLTTDRDERFAALSRRRPFHPYARWGLSRAEVGAHLKSALRSLDYAGIERVDEEVVFPTAYAAPYSADIVATSTRQSAITAGERVGVVACPALADWSAARLVDALNSTRPDTAVVVEAAPLSSLPGASSHSVKVATQLAAALEDAPGTFAAALEQSVDAHGIDLLTLPPCLGRSWTEHVEIFGALEDVLSCRVAESAAARNSIHGWRLDRYLRSRNALEVVSARAVSAAVENRSARAVNTVSDTVSADAVILATGRWIGRGLPGSAPLREPIFGVDLWLDGGPIRNPEEAWPPRLLEELPWGDHPLFRAGVATDETLRPLDLNGAPAVDNVFAAGRLLAGFNPIWDGTTMGVDLISGRLAALFALEYLGIAASREEMTS
ncbi:hypothetical protein FIV42_27985 [Persicimonas caeni]|uniref:FAD-dependent oxidoreductase n=1 Tax=Persicimonas caeni TaxID=2292766 RepID=A0A4Y6Q1J1_PERCE|nr:hypothetical protein [Persicimonas caeni]QDG54446.1 hypothetical protein FIV42_27985 [Persicimonas caeni]QED35667.1 hypothetical protein FRD00_27980 [Persicimonas caeni]